MCFCFCAVRVPMFQTIRQHGTYCVFICACMLHMQWVIGCGLMKCDVCRVGSSWKFLAPACLWSVQKIMPWMFCFSAWGCGEYLYAILRKLDMGVLVQVRLIKSPSSMPMTWCSFFVLPSLADDAIRRVDPMLCWKINILASRASSRSFFFQLFIGQLTFEIPCRSYNVAKRTSQKQK